MKQRADPRRRAMGALGARQHGVVARRQLIAIGFTSDEVLGMADSGRLHPVHRGVFHVGHPEPTRLGRHVAANLAFGRATAISHRPATVLRALLLDRGDPSR